MVVIICVLMSAFSYFLVHSLYVGRFGIYAETLLNLSTLYMVVIICVLMSAFSYTFRAFDATFFFVLGCSQ